MAEQLAFDERFRQRGAVDRQKRLATAGADLVDRAGGDFFARASFARDEDRRFRRSGLLQDREHGAHGMRAGDHAAENALAGQLALQPLGVRRQAALRDGALQDRLQFLGPNRLLQVPEGSELVDRLHRHLDAAECRKNDRRRSVARVVQFLKQLPAVHHRHVQIGDHGVRVELREAIESFPAIGRRLGLVAPQGEHLAQRGTLVEFVVYHQHSTGRDPGVLVRT